MDFPWVIGLLGSYLTTTEQFKDMFMNLKRLECQVYIKYRRFLVRVSYITCGNTLQFRFAFFPYVSKYLFATVQQSKLQCYFQMLLNFWKRTEDAPSVETSVTSGAASCNRLIGCDRTEDVGSTWGRHDTEWTMTYRLTDSSQY